MNAILTTVLPVFGLIALGFVFAKARIIDAAAEIQRLEKQIAEKQKHLQGTKAKLANESFVSKAPADVVQQQREQVADLEKQIRTMEENLQELRQS